jgi:hypothetical protein
MHVGTFSVYIQVDQSAGQFIILLELNIMGIKYIEHSQSGKQRS